MTMSKMGRIEDQEVRDSLVPSDKNMITEGDDDNGMSIISQVKENYVMSFNKNDNSSVQIHSQREQSDYRSSNVQNNIVTTMGNSDKD